MTTQEINYVGWLKLPNRDTEQCLHKQCSECHGSGKRKDGSFCIHHLSCPCSQCNPAKWTVTK